MKHLLKKSTLVALVLLHCTTMVHGQVVSGAVDAVVSAADVPSNTPAADPAPPAVVEPAPSVAEPAPTVAEPAPTVVVPVTTTAAVVVPTTTVAPVPVPTTTNAPANPPAAATTNAQQPEASKADPVVTDKSTNAGTAKPTGNTNNDTDKNNNSSSANVSGNNNPSGSKNNNPQASQTGSTANPSNGSGTKGEQKEEEGSGSNKTAIIAGSVVGGLVGIALIAGLLTWLNRHGGCTSRTRRRDIQQDFEAHDNEYDLKMTENITGGGGGGGGVGMVASNTGAMHSSDNLSPQAPFQRRFVPPTSNPTGYMNLTDEEYGYHNGQTNSGYQQQQPQQQQQTYGSEYDYQQQQHPEYQQHEYQQQEYRNEYGQQQHQSDFIPHHEYANNDYTNTMPPTVVTGGAYGQAYYHTNSNVTSPTLTNVTATGMNDPFRQQLKPDQIEQKPNEL